MIVVIIKGPAMFVLFWKAIHFLVMVDYKLVYIPLVGYKLVNMFMKDDMKY